jgi:hypothetical protein
LPSATPSANVRGMPSAVRLSLVVASLCVWTVAQACTGRTPAETGPDDDDGIIRDGGGGGDGGTIVDDGVTRDGGVVRDGGASSEGEGEGEGEDRVDGGVVDAGHGFDLGGLWDGGLPEELSCLPTSLPELSLSGAFDALGLSPYTGRSEPGVRCGDVVCGDDEPCCVLCGYGACAGVDDAGVADCPTFTTPYLCDGREECARGEVCCFTLSGTGCRAEADCDFDVGDALSRFIVDGGIARPEPPPPTDAGFLDGGFTDIVFLDGGFADGGVLVLPGEDGGVVDAGFVVGPPVDGGFTGGEPIDGGPAPGPDAGSLLEGLQRTLDQGVPVCTSTLLGCDVLSLELCCTSERLTAVDVGFCLPAALCVGSVLP